MEGEDGNSEEMQPQNRKLKKLYNKIRKQMEFYFSDSNLVKDKFLNDLISKDPDGFVDIEVFKKFNKIKELTSSSDVIATSCARSSMFEVSENRKRLRRTTPIELSKDFDACTLYVEGLPKHADQKWVRDVLGHLGTIRYVNVPRYKASNKIKGFAFVEFENPQDVQNACEFYKQLAEKESSSESEEEDKNVKKGKKNKHEDSVNNKKNKKSRTRSVTESSDKETDSSPMKRNRKQGIAGKDLEPRRDHLHQKRKRKRKRVDSDSEINVKKSKKISNGDPVISTTEAEKEMKVDQSSENTGSSVCKAEERVKTEVQTVKKSKETSNGDPGISTIKAEKEMKTDEPQVNAGSSVCKAEEQVTEDEENITEVPADGTSEMKPEETQSKRKRKKAKHTEKPTLRVMTKSEWKAYRNKYLELQRTTMSYLKKQIMLEMQELKEHERNAKPVETKCATETKKPLQFQPGVILKVKLKEPVRNISDFKTQVKTAAVVAYIEAPADSSEMFIRCHNPEDAQVILQKERLKHFGKAELLQGDEEKKYWEKIETDRKNKFSNPVPHKKRGREKIAARAAKLDEMKNRHIFFDE